MFLAAALAATVTSPCSFRPQLQLVPIVSQRRLVHGVRSFSAQARIAFAVRTAKKTRSTNDAGLRAHVLGYYTIAGRLTQASQARANGATPEQARSRLAKVVAALAHDVNVEYARQARIYDAVTENGRAQNQGPEYGFPGGANAAVACPQ